jgi:hypothetical protein
MVGSRGLTEPDRYGAGRRCGVEYTAGLHVRLDDG